LGAASSEEQRRVAGLLREALRRAEDLEAPVRALVLVAEHAPALAGEVTVWLEEIDRALITPGVAVSLALSHAPELQGFARRLAGDERLDGAIRLAVDEALGADS
jgi:hypothetical protein